MGIVRCVSRETVGGEIGRAVMVENVRVMADALGGDSALIENFDTSNIPGSDSTIDQAED